MTEVRSKLEGSGEKPKPTRTTSRRYHSRMKANENKA